MEITPIVRRDRAAIRFSGNDAHRLLNDVLTGPIPTAPGQAAWWALLSPQGKILAEGRAGFFEDALLLDVHTSFADDFMRRMRMYRLRAAVTIEDLRPTHAVGWSAVPVDIGISHAIADIGYRLVAPLEAAANWSGDDSAYTAARIKAGIAELGTDFAPDTTFAHDIGMDLRDGIDFEKGCYVGQEVVSRMKHRGTARRRPVIVTGLAAGDANAPVLAGEREAGTVGAVVSGSAVAILRLDRISDPAAATVHGKTIALHLPLWARYGFGESDKAD